MKKTLKIVILLCLTAIMMLCVASCDELLSTLMPSPQGTTPAATTPVPHVHTEEPIAKVEPTCTEPGLSEGKKCSDCGEILVKQDTIEPLKHVEVIDKAVDPTCTETGLTEGKHCSLCNTVIVKQETVDPLKHVEVIDKAVAATCTETDLTEGKHCDRCNATLLKQRSAKFFSTRWTGERLLQDTGRGC